MELSSPFPPLWVLLCRLQHKTEEFSGEIGFETSKGSPAGLTLLLLLVEIGSCWFARAQTNLGNHVKAVLTCQTRTNINHLMTLLA